MLMSSGLTVLSNYMLYNFHYSPTDLFERMRLNVTLNEELGVRVLVFSDVLTQPTNRPDRGHIGKAWTRYQLRSMEIILQATHGVVSGRSPDFFKRRLSAILTYYERILSLPHDFIFNRDWYDHHGGRGEYDEFQVDYRRLTADEERGGLLRPLILPATCGATLGAWGLKPPV